MPSPSGCVLLLIGTLVLPASGAAQCPDGTPPPCGPARVARPRVQVLNFTAADSADTYLASGLSEDVRTALLGSGTIVLLGPRARSGADYIVSAQVRRSRVGVVVAARMERPVTSTVVWSGQLSRSSREVPGLGGDVARLSLNAIGLRAGPRRQDLASTDPAVYDLFMRGRYYLSRRTEASLARAVALFREAIAVDSTSPLGWVGIARALERANTLHLRISGLPADNLIAQELAAAERAVELAPHDPDVLVMRSLVATTVDPTTSTGAIQRLREALAIDSLNADAWRFLAMRYLEIGDRERGLAANRRAVAVGPEDAELLGFVAIGWFFLRDLDSAAVWAERAVTADPTSLTARGIAGEVALWRGRLDDAEAHFLAAERLGMGAPSDQLGRLELIRVYMVRGDSARAHAYLAREAAAADSVTPSAHMAIAMADAYLAVGDTARGIWWLERHQPSRSLHFRFHLRGEPAFDGIRDNPRFAALLANRP